MTLLEKYQPKTFDKLFLPARIKNNILEKKDKGVFRLLLFGTPGTGKTTTARLIAAGHEILYLSGSNDFSVTTLREKIYPFAGNHSVLNKTKTIIIDEFENIKNAVQDSFKIILDQSKTTNFIFITNEVEKVNTAVKSRCSNIEYNFQNDELVAQKKLYINFALDICKAENLKYDDSGIGKLIKLNFPDFRHLLIMMQDLIDSKFPITSESIDKLSENGIQNIDLYETLNLHDPQKFYEKCTTFKGLERECIMSLGEPYFKYLYALGKFEQIIKTSIIVAKYSNMLPTAINKFGILFACMSEIKTLNR